MANLEEKVNEILGLETKSEKIEETNQVGELTADEKTAYDEWKKSQSKQKIPFLKDDGTPKFFM